MTTIESYVLIISQAILVTAAGIGILVLLLEWLSPGTARDRILSRRLLGRMENSRRNRVLMSLHLITVATFFVLTANWLFIPAVVAFFLWLPFGAWLVKESFKTRRS